MGCLLFDELLIHEVPDSAEDGNAGDNDDLANGLEYILHMNAHSILSEYIVPHFRAEIN